MACAVRRRRFPVGASPTRQTLQPEATGAAMEVTKWLKPSDSVSRYTVTARVYAPPTRPMGAILPQRLDPATRERNSWQPMEGASMLTRIWAVAFGLWLTLA